MANTFIALQDYSSAREYLEKGIALCPNSSAYWSTLGEVYRATDKPEEAKSAYNKALDFGPTDYDAREKLRNLEGKRPVFENFSFVDIDSLVRSAPTAEDYPDDGAVILLNDAKRVVYERGASESTEEVLVRVFNSDGIQDFNEYWIGYNPYTEDVVFEKGVVIKSDGSEVPADENNGHLVFKSLEKGDFIYIKWRIRSHYSGKLSHHFWDEHDFNGFYPMRSVRYAILTPKNTTFQTRGQYMADKPSLTRDTNDGRLMLWEASNEPAMVYEYYMPGLEDVGKRLYVSSVSNWEYMVDWYLDLAHTKTRSTYEVKEVVQRLLADKENLTEEDKIKAIYDYVTDAIHYSSVSFRQSGLIPQRARDVLVNRIGDCKDKAALAISMFREIGMEAYYVLLNTKDEGLNKHVLPSIAFNHAIVGLRTSRGTQYLDLTAQNFPLGTIPDGDRGAFALEVRPGTKKPFHLSSDNLLKSRVTRESDIEIDNNLRMLARKKVSRSGAVSAHMRDAYRFKGEKERLQRFTEVLVQDFPNVKVTHLQFDDMDALTPDQVYEYEFEVPEYANDAGGFMILQLPWSDKLEPTKALSYEKRVYPYNYWPSADTLKETLRVTLPEGSEVLEIAEPVSYSCSVADYSMKMLLEDGVLVCERVEVNKKAVVGPEEYEEFRAFYNKVIKADEKQILVKRGQLSAK
jgi:tetratricopeptide (TPR) repeat protein